MTETNDANLVFNVVWTGNTFRHMHHFVDSVIEQTSARFRYILNACDDVSIDEINDAASARSDRVIDVVDVSRTDMIAHGVALDAVYDRDDNSELFCFIDTDIKAKSPFVADFLSLLQSADGVTSGKEVWTDDNVVPPGHPGVGGRHFFRADGYVYGSPHFAMYKRAALDDTFGRWDVGFGAAGRPNVNDEAWNRLVESGHEYLLYDTAKIVNILLQEDGHRLVHEEHDALVHIGGLAHYMAPPDALDAKTGEPTWAKWNGMEARSTVARYAADTLKSLDDGREAPPLPDTDPVTTSKLVLVRDELVEMAMQPLEVRLQRFMADYAESGDALHIDHTVQVTSFGGAGTTALCGHLDACNADIQSGPGHWPFKHRRTPPTPDEIPDGFRVIYLVGDPRDAVVSLFRRGYQVGHFRAMREREPDEQELLRLRTIESCLEPGDDLFDLAGHVDGWLRPGKGFRVLAVRQDALSSAWPSVASFAGLDDSAPALPAHERSSKWRSQPDPIASALDEIYGPLASRLAALPQASIIDA